MAENKTEENKTIPIKITNKVIITGIDLCTAGSFENFLNFSRVLPMLDTIPLLETWVFAISDVCTCSAIFTPHSKQAYS